ncbi:MAG: glycosyltransferase family 4 protein [Pseudomonadota bacterium]
MMNILYHHRSRGEKAEGIHISEVVKALRQLGNFVYLVCPLGIGWNHPGCAEKAADSSRRRSFLSKLKNNLPVLFFRLLEIGYNFFDIIRLYRVIKKIKPDFIYSRYALFTFSSVLCARLMRIPIILEVNTPYAHAWKQYDTMYFFHLACIIEKWCLKNATHLITVTGPLKNFVSYQYQVPPAKISVMHNGVDLNVFGMEKADPESIRRKYNLPDVPTVGFIGALRKWHGIDLLIENTLRVIEECPEAQFVIVGEGELEEEYKNFVSDHNLFEKIIFTGFIPHEDVPGMIATMDIGLMPNSNAYGSPMKVFEYMAMQKPVIAPMIPTLEEIVDNGYNGILFDPSKSENLGQSIIQLLKNESLRKLMGERAQQKIINQFTWMNNGKGILEIYHRLSLWSIPNRSKALNRASSRR